MLSHQFFYHHNFNILLNVKVSFLVICIVLLGFTDCVGKKCKKCQPGYGKNSKGKCGMFTALFYPLGAIPFLVCQNDIANEEYDTAVVDIDKDPDSKAHRANMGPIWDLSAPDGPHVGPMDLAIGKVMYGVKWRTSQMHF